MFYVIMWGSSFHKYGHTKGFIHRRERWKHLLHHNKQFHLKTLHSSFDLNSHSLGFTLQTIKMVTCLL